MILLIDNYDSFTWNLWQLVSKLGAEVRVERNDALSADEVERLDPRAVIVSPGPGDPDGAGVSEQVVRRLPEDGVPVLGVCLGMQCIGSAFGGSIIRSPELRHGKTSPIEHDGEGVFRGLPESFDAVRYHSLVIDPATLPSALVVSATTLAPTGEQLIMGVRHRELPLEGVQFHPESIATEHGEAMLANWLGSLPT
jgi:anthranilate synthase component 2